MDCIVAQMRMKGEKIAKLPTKTGEEKEKEDIV